jgi:DNA-binding NarL/FixJ family response regulator
MIRVLITDDHQLFREGLTRILNDAPELTVVANVGSGEEALKRIPELKPDVILMDVNMPGIGGVETTRRVRLAHPNIQVLMLTVSERETDLFDAIRAGAHGYLLKSARSAELIDAIQRVHAGEAMIAPVMATKLLDEFARAHNAPSAPVERADGDLSERERQVLEMVAKGMSNKEIGAALSLSPHTVKAHLRTILDKLHLRSRAEAAAWAARHGINPNG